MTWQMVSAKEVKEIPKEVPDWWYKLSPAEMYGYYYKAYFLARELYYDNMVKIDLLSVVKIQLEDSIKVVNLLKKDWKFGLGLSVHAGLNQELRTDVFTTMNFYVNFLRGRVMLNPSLYVKIYDCLGGGLGIGFIVNF